MISYKTLSGGYTREQLEGRSVKEIDGELKFGAQLNYKHVTAPRTRPETSLQSASQRASQLHPTALVAVKHFIQEPRNATSHCQEQPILS